jgi:hypothetical protein
MPGLHTEVCALPSPSLQAKDAYNKFYFRYPNGESRADVVQRATLFTSKLFRLLFMSRVH